MLNVHDNASTTYTMQLVKIAIGILIATVAATSQGNNDDNDDNPCLLYLAQSTIPHAGLGMFTGTPLKQGQLIGRVGGESFNLLL